MLSFLYRLGCCHYGCRGGDHLLAGLNQGIGSSSTMLSGVQTSTGRPHDDKVVANLLRTVLKTEPTAASRCSGLTPVNHSGLTHVPSVVR
jgi:hypothetical protein